MSKSTTIRLGYAIGSGEPVTIPLAHMIVTGQTQNAGKTTTLRAIVARSGQRAVAFATKRGESLGGRAIAPYLPREGDQPIHWRLVESIVASALGQQSMRNERLLIVNASKDARSLVDVRRNVERLRAKSKGRTADDYMLLGEYLDLVLPEMKALKAVDRFEPAVGLNVMDLTTAGPQMQALAIRAVLERVNQHERGILTVLPEAWEFAPNGRNAPAKSEAVAMARKGAALGNFLLSDCQDIVGLDTTIRGASSVWIIGVQREPNELKRTLDVVASSISRAPKPSEVATLGVGMFFTCWGARAVKTYVQPEGMSDAEAIAYAKRGGRTPELPIVIPSQAEPPVLAAAKPVVAVTEDAMTDMTETNALLRQLLQKGNTPTPHSTAIATPAAATKPASAEDELYERFKARLLAELPSIAGGATFVVTPPEKLRKDFQRAEADRMVAAARALRPLAKRVLKLLETTSEFVSQPTVAKRIGRGNNGDLGSAVRELASAGFAEAKERVGVRTALRTKIASDLDFYKPTEDEVEAVYQTVLHDIATDVQAD